LRDFAILPKVKLLEWMRKLYYLYGVI
jgi:hypothetical protein